jgi:hypothetical protein
VLAEPARKEQVARRREVQRGVGKAGQRVVPRFVRPLWGDYCSRGLGLGQFGGKSRQGGLGGVAVVVFAMPGSIR